MAFMSVRKNLVAALIIAASAQLTGCYIETVEEHEDKGYDWDRAKQDNSDIESERSRLHASDCESDNVYRNRNESNKNKMCMQNAEATWLTNCRNGDCRGVDVYVHYMLGQDIGTGHTIVVEAFDNRHFSGSPVSSTYVSDYDATKVGKFEKTTVYLTPGVYYLRAYISDEKSSTPYQYEGMELVGDRPVGVYGALSSVKTLIVKPKSAKETMEPLNIYLDKLFQKPKSAADSRAFLRLLLTVGEDVKLEQGRQVRIGLYRDTDLARIPVVSMTMPSENLLVAGRQRKAEFVSNSLPTGQYLVFVYLDTNGNGYFDQGEPAQLSTKGDQPTMLNIQAERTETLSLTLTENFTLPAGM